MKHTTLLFIVALSLFSCTESDNVIDFVFNNVTNGAVLYTQRIDNLTLDASQPEQPIALTLEYQDGKGGVLLDRVEVFINYTDRTPENGNNSAVAKLFKTIPASEFENGINDNPITNLTIETTALLGFFNLTQSDVHCTDRFTIDLILHLTDGRSFSNANSDSTIISLTGSTGSPFRYDVYVVDGIDNEFLTGTYTYTSVQDGFNGPTFIMPDDVEITTPRPNTRTFEIIRDAQTTVQGGLIVRSQIEFTIACDELILRRYVRSAIVCSANVEGDQQVLLGPSANLENSVDINDDAVFELKFTEAFEGYDGLCGWPETESIIRFSRQ